MPLPYYRSTNRRRRRRNIKRRVYGGVSYKVRHFNPFNQRMRFMNPARGSMYVKRITSGRMMTQYNTSASAGSTCTWNSAFNTLTLATAAVGGSHYFGIACAFALDDIPSITDFTALYDLYKICGAKMKIIPYNDTSLVPSNVGGYGACNAIVHHVQDDDDIVAPTASDIGVDELRQYTGYRTQSAASKRYIKRYIRPKISLAGAGAGAFNVAVNVPPKWINCAYTNATHYGFKAIFEIFNTSAVATTFTYKIEPTYYLGFKNVR